MNHELTVGVDIGGTKTLAALIDQQGVCVSAQGSATPAADGPDAVLRNALALVDNVLDGASPSYVGIGSAGVIDPSTGRVVSATDSLPAWTGTDLVAAVRREYPSAAAAALNDVAAFTLAEATFGAGAGSRSVLGVMAGTGIGGALVLDGKPYFGRHSAAGHIGHMAVPGAEGLPCPCGRTGHLEAAVSGPSMTAAHRRCGGDSRSLQEVAAAGAAGEAAAQSVLDRGAEMLGYALGSLVNILDPDVVVVSGGVTSLGLDWFEKVTASANAQTIPAVGIPEIRLGKTGNTAVALGASYFVRQVLPGSSAQRNLRAVP